MKIYNFKDMIGGWFVGNFKPSAYKTKDFEVSYKIHKKNEKWDTHYHKKAIEVNLLVKGKMKIQNKILKANDIFVLDKKEIADPIFLTTCHLVVVKVPSISKVTFSNLIPKSSLITCPPVKIAIS